MRPFFNLVFTLLFCTSGFAQQRSIERRLTKENDTPIFKKRVWRILELSDTLNAPLRIDTSPFNGAFFPSILSDGIKSHVFNAYGDTSLSLVLTENQFDSSIVCSADTSCRYPQQIKKYVMVDDWIFDRRKGEMVATIVALAPLAIINGSYQPVFWVSYPDARGYFSRFHISSLNNNQNGVSWDDFFNKRMFSANITKVQNLLKPEEPAFYPGKTAPK
jgi:gliding motility associated protien GldN